MEHILVRKVAQDVLMFVWYKQKLLVTKPRPDLTSVPYFIAELMDNLGISVWIDSYCNEFIWAKYFKNHFKCMTASTYSFAKHVYHACYIFNKDVTDANESFFGTLSLVTQFVLYCWQRERKEFLNTCVELFCAFFEKEIRSKFEEQGSWQNLNAYLVENHENLQKVKALIEVDDPPFELYQQLEDAHRQRDIEDITENQVEENSEAIHFADSVSSKLEELCKQTLTEVIAGFVETDNQQEELFRKMVEEDFNKQPSSLQNDQEKIDVKASEREQSSFQKDPEEIDEKARKEEQSSLQKDQEALHYTSNIVVQSSSQGVRDKDQKDPLETLYLDLIKSQDFDPALQESDPNPKLTKEERTKMLLRDLLVDFEKLSKLVDSIDVKNPKLVMEAGNV